MFGYISKENYKNAGLEVTYVDGISITGYNVEGGLDVVIPSMINGKKVIGIGDYAFTHSGIIPKVMLRKYQRHIYIVVGTKLLLHHFKE